MRWILIIALISLLACKRDLGDDLPTPVIRLVVHGWVTDLSGPYTITVQSTGGVLGSPQIFNISNAEVKVIDNFGTVYDFLEVAPGIYQSGIEFQGQIGARYFLEVITGDGRRYRSAVESLLPVAPIEAITCAVALGANEQPGFNLEVEFIDPPIVQNQYRWITYINDEPQNRPLQMRLGNDKLTDGDRQLVDLGFFLIQTGDQVVVEQRSLSEPSFDYLSLLITQAQGLGNTFSPNPALVVGNMYNVDNPNEVVLGYFGASAVTTIQLIK